jgi:hypothetical protein
MIKHCQLKVCGHTRTDICLDYLTRLLEAEIEVTKCANREMNLASLELDEFGMTDLHCKTPNIRTRIRMLGKMRGEARENVAGKEMTISFLTHQLNEIDESHARVVKENGVLTKRCQDLIATVAQQSRLIEKYAAATAAEGYIIEACPAAEQTEEQFEIEPTD